MELKCNKYGHESFKIISLCPKINCQDVRISCKKCISEFHFNHVQELKPLTSLKELYQQKKVTLKRFENLQNNLLQSFSQINELLKAVSIDFTDIENYNLKQLEDFATKLVMLEQIEQTKLTQTIVPHLAQSLLSFKDDINNTILACQKRIFRIEDEFRQGTMKDNFTKAQILNSPTRKINQIYSRSSCLRAGVQKKCETKQKINQLTNSQYFENHFQIKQYTNQCLIPRNPNQQEMELEISCPPDCVCQSEELRSWKCQCGKPYYLKENWDIFCVRCFKSEFIKYFKFSCEKAKNLGLYFTFQSASQVTIGISDISQKNISELRRRWNDQ